VTAAEGIGRRIFEARERAGLTQADLAATIGLARPALTKIEGGTRRVTAAELGRIADALGERIEWLVEDPPAAIRSHRNRREPGAPSPVIDRVVERITRQVEFVVRQGALVLPAAEPLPRPTTLTEADTAAAAVRGLLGLDAAEPLLELSERSALIGLLTFSIDLGTESADAASVLLPRGGVALVNGHLRVGRRRLAIAHEIGHHVFADEYAVDYRLAEHDDETAWESRLDRFARALLVPAEALADAWQNFGDDPRTTAVRAAGRFRIDMPTLSRRALEVGLVGPSDAAAVRAIRTTKADVVELGLLVSDELAAPALPRAYAESVLRLYRQETISGPRALDLLLDTWDETDLPELPPLPDEPIWTFL
jgi:transcriptional regulator with XRE-family HTH domain